MARSKKLQDSTSLFVPINKAHAIVEVVFFIQFSGEFSDQNLRELVSLKEELKRELPRFNEVPRIAFQLSDQGGGSSQPQIIEKASHIQMQRIAKDGTIEWMLRVSENEIAVHCLDYTRWQKVQPRALKFIQIAMKKLESDENHIAAIGLKNIDRFIFEGNEADFDISKLFQKNTDLLFKKAFSAGLLWHCHTGWFEEESAKKRQCLSQLNVATAYINMGGSRRHVTTLEHTATVRFVDEAIKIEYLLGKETNAEEQISPIMDSLHQINKRVLSDLLTEEMSRRVNLKMETGM